MVEYVNSGEEFVDTDTPVIFENNTASAFSVTAGIIFKESGIYEVSISGNRITVSKAPQSERKRRKWTDNSISRQDAIDAINSHFGFNVGEEYGSAVQEVINGLPPAQPEVIRCKDCKYWGSNGYCVYGSRLAWIGNYDDYCSRAERKTDE